MMVNSWNRYILQREGTVVLLLTTFFGCFLLLRPGSLQMAAVIGQTVQVSIAGISGLLALPLFLPGAKHTGWHPVSLLKERVLPKTPQQWVSLLLFLSILCHTIGQSILLYNRSMHIVLTSTSWVHVACLGALLPLLLSILLLPSKPLPIEKRLHIILDGLMMMVGAFTFIWYFILGPSILKSAATITDRVVSAAYPLGALFLIFCLLLLVLRTNNQHMSQVVLFLSLGLADLTFTYSVFCYNLVHHLYRPGNLLEVGWALGYLLVGLAARAMYVSMRSTNLSTSAPSVFTQEEPEHEFVAPHLWRSLLPYALIPSIVLLLVGTSYLGGDSALEPGVYLGGMTLVGLLVIRQIFAVRATVAQNDALCFMQQDLRETNNALIFANGQLEQQTKQLEQANEQLAHLNRLRDQFIANVNHELRTPLTQIDGYLELLSEYQGRLDETTQATFIKHAKDGSQELLLLVNNLLDALRINSEIEPPHLENVALRQVVHEVCEQFPPMGEQGSRLREDIPASFVVKADQRYLRQIIRNLLSNALKYSPPETSVTISANLADCKGISSVCICVQDAGLGISPEEQALLFQKFVRLKRDLSGPVRGTGLGLYMCKQLVESMNGEIWVESSGKKGEGSRFCFTLIVAC
jgi:signal transduction histidine kinase